ncbi:MAG: hypothetical protein DHS20C21_02980 [Gemmatimonadota bacterium]|nr:MAG: hypothetical protein DHS20C21_02980 [Gemmatimonadota bacterium]
MTKTDRRDMAFEYALGRRREDLFERQAVVDCEWAMHKCQSPIEELFALGLVSLAGEEEVLKFEHGNEMGGPDYVRTLVFQQFEILNYRADFFLQRVCDHEKSVRQIVVECDGHDFHDRTKEQARRDKKRDREMQVYCPVLRFTGSEIYADHLSCARQALEFLRSTPAVQEAS